MLVSVCVRPRAQWMNIEIDEVFADFFFCISSFFRSVLFLSDIAHTAAGDHCSWWHALIIKMDESFCDFFFQLPFIFHCELLIWFCYCFSWIFFVCVGFVKIFDVESNLISWQFLHSLHEPDEDATEQKIRWSFFLLSPIKCGQYNWIIIGRWSIEWSGSHMPHWSCILRYKYKIRM